MMGNENEFMIVFVWFFFGGGVGYFNMTMKKNEKEKFYVVKNGSFE